MTINSSRLFQLFKCTVYALLAFNVYLFFDEEFKAAALQFPLMHPSVACVLPGARSAAEVECNARWLAMDIPAGLWSDLMNEELLHPDAAVDLES